MPHGGSPTVQDIKAVIAKQLDATIDGLSDDRLLATNLGTERERAKALFAALSQQFGLKGEIDLGRYFEGFSVRLQMAEFSPILRLLYPHFREQWRTAPPRPDISVGHLVATVQAGVWSEPPPLKAPEPMIWVGKEVLMPLWKVLVFLAYALCYVLAAAFIGFVIFKLGDAVRDGANGSWSGAVFNAMQAIFWGFFVLLMFENTQRRVRARFGLSWDWRRGRLREPRPTPIDQLAA
jgi:hypothetical protein